MPLKDRLQEVISRYEKAASLVDSYKEGQVTDEDLARGFKRLRKERKEVDENNRNYIREQRRLHMGDDGSQRGADEESVEAETLASDQIDESEYDEDDYEEEEEEEEGEGDADDEGGEGGEAQDPEERRLWRQYGSFWRR